MIAAAVALFLFGGDGRADEKEDGKNSDKEALYTKLEQAPVGVYKATIEKDKAGRIQSCLIVGRSRISTTLGKAKGLEVAEERARTAAVTAFVRWLQEDVTVYQKQEDETVTLMEGAEKQGEEDGKREENSKAIEKNTRKFESTSKALVRLASAGQASVRRPDGSPHRFWGHRGCRRNGREALRSDSRCAAPGRDPDAGRN
jgi:hypothetical protein